MVTWAYKAITDKGLALLAKLIEGTTLTITRAVTGTGYVNPSSLAAQTAVTGVKQTMTFRGYSYPENGKCKLPCRVDNTGLTTGYTAKQVGIYASDPDDGEILFLILQDEDGTDIPTESESPGYTAEWNVIFGFGQADSVVLTVDPSGTVTVHEMEVFVDEALANAKSEILKETTPISHASTDTKYGAASATQYGHAKASAITPKAPGTAAVGSETSAFSRGDHVHPMQVASHGITTAGTGEAYTATVDGITALKAGASFIMVPHTVSTSTSPTLNVNGLGAKNIRRRLSNMTSTTQVGYSNGWLAANKPVHVIYDGTYWIVEELAKPAAADLYGTLSIEKGGTGATSAEVARNNLGVLSADAIPNLYVWKKYTGAPDTIIEKPSENVNLATSYYNPENSTYYNYTSIEYADEISFGNGTVSLANPTTISKPKLDNIDVVKGKYVNGTAGLCYIPEDATFTTGHSTVYYLAVDAATLILAPAFLRFEASGANDTYPTNGEHTDGYWYIYHKQLGE